MKKETNETGPADRLENLTGSAKEYLDMRIDAIKLRMVENIAVLMSRVIYAAIFLILATTGIAFMAAALSSYIGEALDSTIGGNLITAAIFLLAAIIISFFKKRMFINSLVRMLITMFFDGITDDKNENNYE